MTATQRALTISLLVATLLAPLPGAAATATIGIAARVPVVCAANIQGTPTWVGETEVALGQVSTFCNASGGYQLVVEYDAGASEAFLQIGDYEVPLSSDGSTTIPMADGPVLADAVPVSLRVPEGQPMPANVRFRAVAL